MGAEEDRKEKGCGGRGGGVRHGIGVRRSPGKAMEALFLSGCPKAMILREGDTQPSPHSLLQDRQSWPSPNTGYFCRCVVWRETRPEIVL